ncbi:MAG: hypothetical protein IRZ28_13170 [Steroidobacteraceae bacterium]|nr:hypothetical protein [Steroidobacteraceae bacterium]
MATRIAQRANRTQGTATEKSVYLRPRSVGTSGAARYTGFSVSYLKMLRRRAPNDPQGAGPPFRRVAANKVLYDIADLDAWLDSFPSRRSTTDADQSAGRPS